MLVSQHRNDRQDLDEWDSDTDTVCGVSDTEITEIVEPTVEEVPVPMDARVRAPVRAFTSLDAINLTDLFEHRAKLMQSVLHTVERRSDFTFTEKVCEVLPKFVNNTSMSRKNAKDGCGLRGTRGEGCHCREPLKPLFCQSTEWEFTTTFGGAR